MKGQKSVLLFILAVVSLAAIGTVVALNILKGGSNKPAANETKPNILGEVSVADVSPTPVINVTNLVQSVYQNTKDAAQQKVVEVQKTVLTTIEKEISTLTQSQVDAFKQQICRDWGVIH